MTFYQKHTDICFRHGLNFIKLDGDIGCLGKHVMKML